MDGKKLILATKIINNYHGRRVTHSDSEYGLLK